MNGTQSPGIIQIATYNYPEQYGGIVGPDLSALKDVDGPLATSTFARHVFEITLNWDCDASA